MSSSAAEGLYRWRGARQYRIRREADQFRRIPFEKAWIACGKAPIDPEVSPLDPAEPAKRPAEHGQAIPSPLVWHQHADAANTLRLLCPSATSPQRKRGSSGNETVPAQLAFRRGTHPMRHVKNSLSPPGERVG